jgi:Cellulase (glycosyl hydrolase family 5)
VCIKFGRTTKFGKSTTGKLGLFFGAICFCLPLLPAQVPRWSESAANAWYAKQPWLIGANYIPSTAVNQLEMWQADTFDPARIDMELGWAQGLGMNTMRVFLHDLLWQQDSAEFLKRVDTFLRIASKHNIRIMFVLFDSCWDPHPKLGKQLTPRPGVHNSRWLQSPGAEALNDSAQYARLAAYVKGVVGAFADDPRVLAWDVWNEPYNVGEASVYLDAFNKKNLVMALLPRVFAWAREAKPSQPLTSGLTRAPGPPELSPGETIQIDSSDIVSFHQYADALAFRGIARLLASYGRPVLCTEYMARTVGSTFQAILPVAKPMRIAVYNWGLVAGKTQTYLPYDSWRNPYLDRQPRVWHHDIFHPDGSPYNPLETDFIQRMTDRKPGGLR